jgi:hypothetical protein
VEPAGTGEPPHTAATHPATESPPASAHGQSHGSPGPTSPPAAALTAHAAVSVCVTDDVSVDNIEHERSQPIQPTPVVQLSAEQFLEQPLDVTIATAAAQLEPIIQVDGRRFCTHCRSFTCDHAFELDFEWTADDDAALIAADFDDDDEDATSFASNEEEALLAD